MVTLTRLGGSLFALNSDLIERVDSTPDTVITLVDGTRYHVRETLQEVVDKVRLYRGSVIAAASSQQLFGPETAGAQPPRGLSAVPNDERPSVIPFPQPDEG
jgi:flagellar protein FlbD